MKKIILFGLLVLCLQANPIDDKAPQFVYQGAPVSSITKEDQYLIKKNYAIHYRYDTKTAEYVVEHVTKEGVSGVVKRKDNFRPDPAVALVNEAQLGDYANSSYDRGHLVPAGDNTQSADAMDESFVLSNMIPQNPNHNRGIWKQVETLVRDWVLEGKDIYVVTGTIYSKGYQTIGIDRVGVPTYLWKVIVDKKTNKSIAFLFPNTALPVTDLPKYIVSISEIEAKTGINFMPKLTAEQQNAIERTKANLKDWSGISK